MTAKRTPRQTEKSFQTWVDRLLGRVVMPAMFTTAIDVAANDMAHIGRRMSLQARGYVFGLPDVFVCQKDPLSESAVSLWIELKRGTETSDTQEAVHRAMRRAGQAVVVCSSMAGVVAGLRNSGFDVHANAEALAAEYEMRLQAAETAPAKPRAVGKPRKPQVSRAAAARGNAWTARRLGL